MEILAVNDLTFTYPQCSSPALKNICLSLEKGEFAVLCGATGSGKSTLLRMLKRELSPLGDVSGNVSFCGKELSSLDDRTSAASIGFVMQRPEQQIVTDKVWHELAFGLENLGVKSDEIYRRIAEMASYFGIGDWFDRDTAELSGGQKQLLNLASVLVMQPELLILDEPTAQLDPIAAADFIATLKRLNQDFGLTIIMAEHRLEDVVPICDKLIVMEKGSIIADAPPSEAVAQLKNRPQILCGMPAASRIYAMLGGSGSCPLTVREGRSFIENSYNNTTRVLPQASYEHNDSAALEFKDVYFRYSRDGRDILDGLSFTVYSSEIFCILGGNGSGKTTALSAAAGLLRAYSGRIKVLGKKLKEYKNRSLYRECLAMLPQDVQTVFLKNTVREELEECGAELSELPYDISHLLDKHPYDLSGGEQQLAALAKVLAAKPKILLLDEPTKGLDSAAKLNMIKVMQSLKAKGVTIITVTHDVEFAAVCADRCAMFFGGKIVSTGTPHDFFPRSSFYTTAVSRMTRGYYDNIITVDDAAEICRINGRRE
ncbi:ABC transporter ATP-binding protein [Ruminococcus flavefaciens]|uniref:Energy-coupling factor transport system ATP-binding protein n=1 Tax=Ruminococcus flavefaciens TaxID=1265 RepID=A0A1M7LW09_RUMFL|nr:ABC transporter ATP-binding protein [Ruminococcus flavefaciens]SHM82535.1 energy-coupling factor transport system ATP-binding protein [Ruminococcus flavefaciens]